MSKVLVTGIGGVVGQGISRNIKDMNANVSVIGTNVVNVSAGNYLCERVYTVPYAYDENYITAVRSIAEDEGIGLIIPSTDYESYYLGASREQFKCHVACSPAYITKFCLDKYSNYIEFSRHKIPFASSILPSQYKGEFDKCIVKPREGRGSRNIFINPASPRTFDDSYLVQEYLEGPELTSTIYINRSGGVHGIITFVRELEQGNTSKCEVVFEYDEYLLGLVNNILQYYPFSGSFNIQSRVTSKGIVPFEINCRISGTNSVRSQFGFNDVAYTVEEYLFGQEASKPNVIKGSALRVILDIIYPGISLDQISNASDNFYIH
jgi:carbamoyl-phosphate synthase large subunit